MIIIVQIYSCELLGKENISVSFYFQSLKDESVVESYYTNKLDSSLTHRFFVLFYFFKFSRSYNINIINNTIRI